MLLLFNYNSVNPGFIAGTGHHCCSLVSFSGLIMMVWFYSQCVKDFESSENCLVNVLLHLVVLSRYLSLTGWCYFSKEVWHGVDKTQDLKVFRAMRRILHSLSSALLQSRALCACPCCLGTVPASPPAASSLGCFIQGSKALRRLDADFRNIRVQITSEPSWYCTVQCQTWGNEGEDCTVCVYWPVGNRPPCVAMCRGSGRCCWKGWPVLFSAVCSPDHREVLWLSLQTLCWERG